jgi:hypothetical protein
VIAAPQAPERMASLTAIPRSESEWPGPRSCRTGAVSSPLQPEAVATIIKRRAKSADLNAAEFTGHSMRSGSATQATRDGHHPTQIADMTRHKDQRVLAGYIRPLTGPAGAVLATRFWRARSNARSRTLCS